MGIIAIFIRLNFVVLWIVSVLVGWWKYHNKYFSYITKAATTTIADYVSVAWDSTVIIVTAVSLALFEILWLLYDLYFMISHISETFRSIIGSSLPWLCLLFIIVTKTRDVFLKPLKRNTCIKSSSEVLSEIWSEDLSEVKNWVNSLRKSVLAKNIWEDWLCE